MGMERKEKILSLIGKIEPERRNGNTTSSGSRNVVTQGSIVVHGNLTLNESNRQENEHFNEIQTRKIQQFIYNLADLDIACGFTKTGDMSARRKWWYVLRTHFDVSSYKLIPVDQFDDVIQFLSNHLRKLQIKATKASDEKWRNKYYSAIYAKCKENGTSKEELYEMVDQYLDVNICSLSELSGSQLKHLYNLVVEQ